MTWRRLLVAIVVFPATFVLAALATDSFRSNRRDAAEAELESLKSEYLNRRRLALDIGEYRQQSRQLDRMLDALLVQLPNASDRSFARVRSAAKARGLRLDVLAPAKQDWLREFYADTPARIVVTGRYQQVVAFIADLSRLPASMRMEPFVIQRSAQPGMVTLKGVLIASRYLSDDEMEAQRKAARDKFLAERGKQ